MASSPTQAAESDGVEHLNVERAAGDRRPRPRPLNRRNSFSTPRSTSSQPAPSSPFVAGGGPPSPLGLASPSPLSGRRVLSFSRASSSGQPRTLGDLLLQNPRLLRSVFFFLDSRDLARCDAVCYQFYVTAHDDSLWSELVRQAARSDLASFRKLQQSLEKDRDGSGGVARAPSPSAAATAGGGGGGGAAAPEPFKLSANFRSWKHCFVARLAPRADFVPLRRRPPAAPLRSSSGGASPLVPPPLSLDRSRSGPAQDVRLALAAAAAASSSSSSKREESADGGETVSREMREEKQSSSTTTTMTTTTTKVSGAVPPLMSLDEVRRRVEAAGESVSDDEEDQEDFLAKLVAERDEMQRQLVAEIEARKAELADAVMENDRLCRIVEEQEEEIQSVRGQLTDLEWERENRGFEHKEEVARLNAAAAAKQAELDETRVELERARARVAELTRLHQEQVAQLTAQLAATQAEAAQRLAEVRVRDERLRHFEEAARAREAELALFRERYWAERFRVAIVRAQQGRERLNARAAAAEAAAQLQAAESALSETRRELGPARTAVQQLDSLSQQVGRLAGLVSGLVAERQREKEEARIAAAAAKQAPAAPAPAPQQPPPPQQQQQQQLPSVEQFRLWAKAAAEAALAASGSGEGGGSGGGGGVGSGTGAGLARTMLTHNASTINVTALAQNERPMLIFLLASACLFLWALLEHSFAPPPALT